MVTCCPVCRRQVHASESGRVRRHADTAHHTCPMSGHQIPLDDSCDNRFTHRLSLR